jgi:D-glycero-alpha-D-manno-heptose-7-phosphate kinase
MRVDKRQISVHALLRDALQFIEANNLGLVFVCDGGGVVIGVATDGDIRRHLLQGGSLDDPIMVYANTEFVWADSRTPREVLLKKLDARIRAIPLLDVDRRLVGVVSRDHLPLQEEEAVYARARSPVRVSFGGGGSDVTHYFASENDGAVINTTISIYSHATLRLRDDGRIVIRSRDLKETLRADDIAAALNQPGRFRLIQALLKTIRPEFGFELYLDSDFPMSSGLGGSAVISAAILGCFNQFRQDKWDLHELAEIAYQAERLHLGIAGGWQDQYATVFGGFNFMEFRMDQNIVHPLRIHPDTLLELEESLVLCDTGMPHDSGDIHQDQRQNMSSKSVKALMEFSVQLSYTMRNDLLRGRLFQFGRALDKAWQCKRQFSEKISSMRIDQLYAEACMNGAIGGKLLGAGGGGFFLFYVPPFRRHDLIAHLEQSGMRIRPFRFEQEGLQAWTVREVRNHLDIEGS